MPDVRVVNLAKKFGKIVALDNISLEVHDKEYFALLGPSGCGKTTLLRLIAGLIERESGEILHRKRPEIFFVEHDGSKNKNRLRGKIEKTAFECIFVRYVIRFESQDSVVVIKPSLTEKWYNVGESVTLSFAPEKVHVFKYPEAGLMKEISV
jgi:ABC-type sugar transport system ATPase subunit